MKIEFDINKVKVSGKPHVEYGYNVCGCIKNSDDVVVNAWVWDANAALALAKYLVEKFGDK